MAHLILILGNLSPPSPFTLTFGAFDLAIGNNTQQIDLDNLDENQLSSHFVKTQKHKLCLQMLTKGHVESFVDFFYLTHKKGKKKSADEGMRTLHSRTHYLGFTLFYHEKMAPNSNVMRYLYPHACGCLAFRPNYTSPPHWARIKIWSEHCISTFMWIRHLYG